MKDGTDLANLFDAVLFLTWSDWETEPRSNRYHYAKRFARHIPVLFIQNQREVGGNLRVAASEVMNIDLINVSAPIKENETHEIINLLRQRGIKRPLLWIYDSIHYDRLILAMSKSLRVYHATEDYFTRSSAMLTSPVVPKSIQRLVLGVDLIVAVSERVLEKITKNCSYAGETLVAENGCDYEFFARLGDSPKSHIRNEELVVIYQGALNNRLDYDLLYSVALLLPEYKFRFVGRCFESEGTNRLRQLKNVEILGPMSPEHFGQEMYRASVGIIPFIQDEWIRNSLPLKTFEYVACGLPVVSVTIDALAKYEPDGDVIKFASTAQDFADAIRLLSSLRHDPALLLKRRDLARENSYDGRFESVVEKLRAVSGLARGSFIPLNVVLLFDPTLCHVGAVGEHLRAFERYSSHDVTFMPATNLWGVTSAIDGVESIDLSIFDAVIVHYSVHISEPHHLVENLADAVDQFYGLKVLFIQDEYKSVECARAWMDRLRFDIVYTCVPLDQVEDIYPAYRYPGTDFLPTLTGYVPEYYGIERFVTPLEARRVAIAYRGRELSGTYGQLRLEEYVIGTEIGRRSNAIGLQVDISCDEESRIYGDAWYELLGSARGTLGTESGSSVFDFDGSLSAKIRCLKERDLAISFNEIRESVLIEHDGKIRMNQILPKIFEAIRLRTALILFEGEYSGVVKPILHYFPLKKDFSNFEDIVSKLMDDDLVREMTDRAYEDVIASGKYSYKQFVTSVDEDLRVRCLRRRPRRLMYGAVYAMSDQGELRPCLPTIPLGLACAADVLDGRESFQGIQQKLSFTIPRSKELGAEDDGEKAVQRVDGLGNVHSVAKKLALRYGAPPLRKIHAAVTQQPIANRLARKIYSKMPAGVKSRIKRVVKGD